MRSLAVVVDIAPAATCPSASGSVDRAPEGEASPASAVLSPASPLLPIPRPRTNQKRQTLHRVAALRQCLRSAIPHQIRVKAFTSATGNGIEKNRSDQAKPPLMQSPFVAALRQYSPAPTPHHIRVSEPIRLPEMVSKGIPPIWLNHLIQAFVAALRQCLCSANRMRFESDNAIGSPETVS